MAGRGVERRRGGGGWGGVRGWVGGGGGLGGWKMSQWCQFPSVVAVKQVYEFLRLLLPLLLLGLFAFLSVVVRLFLRWESVMK